MIGAFYQPRAVIADTDTLATLPDRELRAGIAEIIKYGLICDREFFGWLEQHVTRLLRRDPQALTVAIERSCVAKARVVAADEREQGQRALLNLGHTFGHAIESTVGYGQWLHGEAVAAGMVMAAYLSMLLGDLANTDFARIRNLIDLAQLPLAPPPHLDRSELLEHMYTDKKVASGRIRLVLLKDIGNAYLSDRYPTQALDDTLRYFKVS